ncbi:TonB-dependent receptor domain-containing protein [Luteimonas vadosa]|uniref:TonB-dependent receptor n=1 Tax=Luteimonas vadosa TaxID=1165507 RepID=A0ABP9DUL9_9GAMM
MTLKTTKLRDAISFALAVGATTLAGTGVALAQQTTASQTQDQEATTLDRIEVTGTRIRQVDVETAQPVTFITREDIEKQGFQSVAEILQNISATGTPPLSRASPLSAGENAGGTFISLRNLGAARNLVLLNGRRLPISTSGLADISKIPTAAVERIEVLKDGASSIYGSDAIAGVINIITRSNFEGAKASAYFGQYGQGDGDITRADAVIGFKGEKGSLTAAAEWREEDPVFARNRPFSAFPRSNLHPTDNWTTVGQFGGFVTTATTPVPGVPAGTRVVLIPGADPRLPSSYRRQDTTTGSCTATTLTSPGPQTCVPGNTADKSNTNLQTDLRTPVESKSLYVDGIWDLTDDIRFRTNMLYSNRLSSRTVAGYPMQAASFASSNNGAGVGIAPTSFFNPYPGQTITNWWRRTWEVPRVSDADSSDYMFSGVFEGSFEFADRFFDWDVGYLWNQSRQVQSTFGNLNLANLRAAVGPSFRDPVTGQVRCGTAASPINGCVPFNPFLPFGVTGAGGLTGNTALENYLFQEEHATGETETEIMTANIAGTIVELPAGALGFAFGVEHRKETGKYVPDALAVTGGSTNLSSGPTRGGYSVNEAYLELQVPILADLPFVKELSLNVASRFSDYDTFGETTNNKFGLKWKPIESLLVRGTIADGFRAPTIADLFGGGSQTFSFYSDPCDTLRGAASTDASVRANCQNGVGGNGALGGLAASYRQLGQGFVPVGTQPSQTPVAFTSGANPALQPELSESKTLGMVWSPTFVEGLNIALDWWNIRIDNTIVGDAPSTILDDCYVKGIASRCVPTLFTRDPALGYPTVTFGNRNAGFREVEGFDFDVNYRWRTDEMGTFSVGSTSTYTSKDVFVSTNDPVYPISAVGFTSTFRIRSNLNLGWEMGRFGVSWMTRYFSKMEEACTYFTPNASNVPAVTVDHLECNDIQFRPTGALNADGTPRSSLSRRREVGSTTFNDVQVRYQTPWDATIAVGANNVFEKYGPVMYSQPSANVSYYGEFDIGRFIYMKYTQKF